MHRVRLDSTVSIADQLMPEDVAPPGRYDGVLRYYELAKRAEWAVRDLPWGEVSPIPETRGSAAEARPAPRRLALGDHAAATRRTRSRWRWPRSSSSARRTTRRELYYSTMVQDESRHTEAWLKLVEEVGGTAERDPHLDRLADMFLASSTRSRRRCS